MRRKKLKNRKGGLTCLLAIVLMLITMPVAAFADNGKMEETTSGGAISPSAIVGNTAWISPFSDVKAENWHYNSVAFAIENELFTGKTDTQFAPNEKMTRGMFVTVLGRFSKEDVKLFVSSEALTFADVKDSYYYAPYIEWAAKKKIVTGLGNYKFAPDRAITREEMAVIMTNYAKVMKVILPTDAEAVSFKDAAQIGSWAKDSINAMQKAGLLTGREDGSFAPKATATRAEVAALMERFATLEQ